MLIIRNIQYNLYLTRCPKNTVIPSFETVLHTAAFKLKLNLVKYQWGAITTNFQKLSICRIAMSHVSIQIETIKVTDGVIAATCAWSE